MAMLRSTRLVWIERAILGNLRRPYGNAVKIRKLTVTKLPKEGFEFCDAEQGCIASRNADWEIEAEDCDSSFSNLVLYPMQEPKVVANQHRGLCPVAVA